MKLAIENLKFDEHGLIPAIVQDAQTREVLTLAYMNSESLAKTIETMQTWFWSRSRQELWHKGETSGNTQVVVELLADCDNDAIVVLVNPAGPACHTGATSCFVGEQPVRKFDAALDHLYNVIQERQRLRPANSYTTYLFDQGLDKILKKVGEESTETIVAAKNEAIQPLVAEVSDLLYHLLVLLVARGVNLGQVAQELQTRSGSKGKQ